MNSLIKLFLDKLSERIFSLIGSSIGSAATTYHAVQQAEQQSLLEDLARQYESNGKLNLAAKLREQAATLANGDPAATGKQILLQVTEEFGLVQPRSNSAEDQPTPEVTNRTSRRGRRIAAPIDEPKAE
jgi:hypothetical protein